jgi:hypothetical protein
MPSEHPPFPDLPAVTAIGQTAPMPTPLVAKRAFDQRPTRPERGARKRPRTTDAGTGRMRVAPAARPAATPPETMCVGEAFRIQYHLLRERRRAAAARRRAGTGVELP